MNKLLVKALKKVNAFKYFSFNKVVRIDGEKFIIPFNNNIGYSNLYTTEQWMVGVLKIILSIENKNFVDVGVNTGQTLLKLKSVSTKTKYIGFEPNPFCVNYVHSLIESNRLENVTLIPVGISDKTEIRVLNFIEDSKADSSASIIADYRSDRVVKRKEYIPLFDFKDLKDKINIDSISVLKIDVEGAELEVIRSFKKNIIKSETILLVEILPAYHDNNILRIERQHKIQQILLDLNYSMFRVIKKNDLLVGFEEVPKIEIHSDLDLCDYVMLPKTKVDKFKTYSNQLLNKYKK